MKNKIIPFLLVLNSFLILYQFVYLYNSNVIDEIELSLEEVFGQDLERESVKGRRGNDYLRFHWKGENDDYFSFSISVESSVWKAKEFMFEIRPWISSGKWPRKVNSPFDEASFHMHERTRSYFSLTAREKNIGFRINSNSTKYPNQVIRELSNIFSNNKIR